MAPTIHALKILLEECETFANNFNEKFNSNKSYFVMFSKTKFNHNDLDVRISNEKIPIKMIIYIWESFEKIMVLNHNPDKFISDIKVRSNVINTEYNHIDSFAKTNFFKSQCMSFLGLNYII